MRSYSCKTENCKGIINFRDALDNLENAAASSHLRDMGDTAFIVIPERPVECPKCRTSYYEWELKEQ